MAKSATVKDQNQKKQFEGFSEDERAAMRERAQELLAGGLNGEAAVLAKIGEMHGLDREIAQRIHALVALHTPSLTPKTWYGMPAYATAEGKVVCFFQSGVKFKARYCVLGFSDSAKLDAQQMWPTSYAISELSPEVEQKITELLVRAVG